MPTPHWPRPCSIPPTACMEWQSTPEKPGHGFSRIKQIDLLVVSDRCLSVKIRGKEFLDLRPPTRHRGLRHRPAPAGAPGRTAQGKPYRRRPPSALSLIHISEPTRL